MKKNYLAILSFFVLMFLSCTKNEIIQSDSISTNQDYLITKDQAISVAESLFKLDDNVNFLQKRSTKNDVNVSVKTYRSKSNKPLFYAITKNDNFYVISADKRLQLVQAYVSEAKGKMPLSLAYFLNSNATAIEDLMANDLVDLKSTEISANISFADKAIVKKENFEGLKSVKRSFTHKTNNYARLGEQVSEPVLSGNWVKYGPFLKEQNLTDWSQDSYILDAKYSDERKHTYLGCITTAIGQLLKFHQNDVESIFEYKNYPFKGAPTQNLYDSILSDFSEKIVVRQTDSGERWAILGGYPKTGEGAINTYVKGVKAKLYYEDNSDKEKLAVSFLKKGEPVIGAGNGHAWVIEGYIKTRTSKANKYSVDKYGEFFYMNWGWYGYYNGWYKMYYAYAPSKKRRYKIKKILAITKSEVKG